MNRSEKKLRTARLVFQNTLIGNKTTVKVKITPVHTMKAYGMEV
jgi:hypothetical protein